MAIEVFWLSGSPFAWRVLLGLAIKGLDYESRLLQASEREHKAPWYLEMNPRGKVPVLRDGGTVLSESIAILAYLDRKYPDPPLFGATPAETGGIWRRIFENENFLGPHVAAIIGPILFGGLDDKVDAVKAAAGHLHEELARLDASLAGERFLAGDDITAADVALYPVTQILLRATNKDIAAPLDLGLSSLAPRYANLAAWAGRIEALPGYDATYPPHWR